MADTFRPRRWPLALALLAFALLWFGAHGRALRADLVGVHAWRQAQTQSNIENFVEEGMDLLRPRVNPRGAGDGVMRMEFPLMQWGFAAVARASGADPLRVARGLSLLLGLASLLGMAALARALLADRRAPALAFWAMAFSPVFFYYSANPMPDNLALAAYTWAAALLARAAFGGSAGAARWAPGLALLGLAALAKLPYVTLSAAAAGWALWAWRGGSLSGRGLLALAMGGALALAPAAAWYAWVVPTWQGNGVVAGAFANPMPWDRWWAVFWSNLHSMLPEMFLNFAYLLPFGLGSLVLVREALRRGVSGPAAFGLAWGAAVGAYYLFELNVIGKEHDYYLLPFLPLLFLVVARGLLALLDAPGRLAPALAVVALLAAPPACLARLQTRWNPEMPGFNPDLLLHKPALRAAVPDDALCLVGQDASPHIFLYHLHKKGWAFDQYTPGPAELDRMIAQGLRYCYSDNRAFEANDWFAQRVDSLLLEAGSFRVFRLRAQE